MKESRDDLIVRCMADRILPLALVYGFYVIIHGNLSPGGGFQGGCICACAVLLVYLGYGCQNTVKAVNGHRLHLVESLGAAMYVVLALLGVLMGLNFCRNVFWDSGAIGSLFSGGTIALMNYTVGLKVLAGVGSIILLMIGLLATRVEDDFEEGGDH